MFFSFSKTKQRRASTVFLTDIGITGGGKDRNMLYLNGTQAHKLKNSELLSKVVSQVEKKAKEIEKYK